MDSADEEKVWRVIRAIPVGSVRGYGEVARLAGFPRRARWVARLLATKTPANVPWHRVLRSNGQLAFPAGSNDFKRQQAALKKDGVEVRNGRVKMPRALGLDAEIWGPPV